jgi:hypothetical protein
MIASHASTAKRAAHASSLALLLTTSCLLAGCGGSSGNGIASKSAAEILAVSRAAAAAASSVHVSSSISQGPLTFTYDAELTSNGGRAQISLLGTSYEVIRIADTLYLKGSKSFYQQLGQAAAKVRPGTWIQTTTGNVQLIQLAELANLKDEITRLLGTTQATKGAATTINGQPAIELKQAAKLYTGTTYIATSGKPYPINITKHGRENGHTTLTNWNQPATLKAPTNTIKLNTLQR